ncbi:hypothetical protein ACFLTZ_03750 [Chloroflexota bacterium]
MFDRSPNDIHNKAMKTKSELLFEKYCASIKYSCNPIPAASKYGKTPDYWVCCGNDKIVAEIKELSPNDDDRRRARELKNQRLTSGVVQPGKRVYDAITDSAKQLKKFAHCRLPCVLVIYDNTMVDDVRPKAVSQLQEPSILDFGMYGLQIGILPVPNSDYYDTDIRATANGRGGERRMTETMRWYISAVSVLCEDQNGGEPYLLSYHNFFACIPLPQHLFRGPLDRHFIKPDHPDKCPQVWGEL